MFLSSNEMSVCVSVWYGSSVTTAFGANTISQLVRCLCRDDDTVIAVGRFTHCDVYACSRKAYSYKVFSVYTHESVACKRPDFHSFSSHSIWFQSNWSHSISHGHGENNTRSIAIVVSGSLSRVMHTRTHAEVRTRLIAIAHRNQRAFPFMTPKPRSDRITRSTTNSNRKHPHLISLPIRIAAPRFSVFILTWLLPFVRLFG